MIFEELIDFNIRDPNEIHRLTKKSMCTSILDLIGSINVVISLKIQFFSKSVHTYDVFCNKYTE